MNRRAQEEVGKVLWELIGLILVVVLISAVLFFAIRAFGSGSSNEETGTTYSFLSLASKITQYSANLEPFVHGTIPLYISNDYTIVGFSAGTETPVDSCGTTQAINRPSSCGTLACLCMFKAITDTPRGCVTFPGVDNIVSFVYQKTDGITVTQKTVDTFKGLQYANLPAAYTNLAPQLTQSSLSMHGKCGFLKNAFGTTPVYLEKAFIEGKNVILVATGLSDSVIKSRQDAVITNAFDSIFAAAENAFNAKNYAEALKHYTRFVTVAGDRPQLQEKVRNAQFKISESNYLLGNTVDAAKGAVAYIATYGLADYFRQTGEIIVTTTPFPSLSQDTQLNPAIASQLTAASKRLTAFSTALPNNALLAFLRGFVTGAQSDFTTAIPLLTTAAQTLTPQDAVPPAVASYILGEAYRAESTKTILSGNDVDAMLNAYANVLQRDDRTSSLLEIRNAALLKLIEQCNAGNFPAGAPQACNGIPIIPAKNPFGTIYPGNSCAVDPLMSLCGQLSLNDVKKMLGFPVTIAVGSPRPNYDNRYSCKDNKWALVDTCPVGQSCRNDFVNGALAGTCFTPATSTTLVTP
jgi:hypothetical protein